MKLVHQDFSRPIFEEKDDFVELIIESPECFGAYISELAEQCKGQEGRYVLSDKEKEVDLAKNVEIIFDIFSLEINEKRILNKLYSEMNELAKSEEFFVKTQEVIQGIQKYLLDLEYATDYILTFEQDGLRFSSQKITFIFRFDNSANKPVVNDTAVDSIKMVDISLNTIFVTSSLLTTIYPNCKSSFARLEITIVRQLIDLISQSLFQKFLLEIEL